MGFSDFVDDVLDDINPLHWINKLNDAIGHSTADILEFLGITDPAVDPDGIREIAQTWKDLADAIGEASYTAAKATTGIALQGEAGTAFGERAKKVQTIASQVQDALNQGHDGLTKLADQAHDLISQVGVLAAQIAEFEVAGLGLTLLTGPLSDAAAALASGSRAERIVAIFGEVEAAVVRAGKMIEDLAAEIGGLSRILKALQSVAKMAAVGGGSAVAWDAMFQPDRLSDPDSILDDAEGGALGGVALGSLFKALRAIGPIGPESVLSADGGQLGALGDLKTGFGSKIDDMLGTMQARLGGKQSWPVVPEVKGPASGKTLMGPNLRHVMSGLKGSKAREENSFILKGHEQDVLNDVQEIANGNAEWDQTLQRYRVNGRTYGIEPNGTVFPDSGPGIVKLDRNEYAALVQIADAGGDLSKAPELGLNPRFVNNPAAVQKALSIYNGTYQ